MRRDILTLPLLFLAAFLPRVLAAGRGLTTDEAYHWAAYRSSDFLAALLEGRFADTMITGHPGVTTMWLGSLGLLLERGLGAAGLLTDPAFPTHLALLRLPVALATALAVVGGALLLRRIVGRGVALVAALLWASDPFLVAHSRLVHLDGLLAMLMLLATLALLAACFNPHARARPDTRLLVVAGVATGLAPLTKSLGVLLLPVGALILVAWGWQRSRAAPERGGLRGPGLALVRAGAVWGGAAVLAAFIAWPALWVAPWQAVASVVNEVIENGGAPHPGTFLLGQHYLTDEPGALFYPLTLFARLTPWVVVGLAALAVASLRRRDWLRRYRLVLLLLLAAALLLPLLLTIPPKKFDRYALPSIPMLHILAACGLCWLGAHLPRLARQTAAGLLATVAVGTLLLYHPYELAYYNSLLGGSARAPALVPVGWGEGLDQVAAWLNQQPDVARGKVATWSPPTLQAYLRAPAVATWQGAIQEGEVGYLVVYVNQDQTRKESQYFGAVQAACRPVHTVQMHGIDYAWVYRVPMYTPRVAGARFGATLALQGGVLVPPAACTCAPHRLTLMLQPLAPPDQPLFLFLHVVAEDGTRVVQVDLPLERLLPPDAWQADEAVPYTLALDVPPDAPAGEYRVLLGLYALATGERLPVQSADAAAAPLEGPGTLRAATFEYLAEQRGACLGQAGADG